MVPTLLKKHSNEIDGVIHIGAHLGQEVEIYDQYNFSKIIFFEPQKDIFDILVNNTNKYSNVSCFNFALGSKSESRQLYKSYGNDGKSSSLLAPDLHLSVQPSIEFNQDKTIDVKRFDDLNIQILNFITLDVQGFELEVLKGFGQELNKVEFIFTEINTKYLYENNALVGDLDKYLQEYNFSRVYTNIDCFKYYGDAFYVKSTNKNYKINLQKKIVNKLVISNYYLHFKKLFYPKKLIKMFFKLT